MVSCVWRTGVYVFCSILFIFPQGSNLFAKGAGENSDVKPQVNQTQFHWNEKQKLTWEDFKGAIPANTDDNAAAATYCSIGFEIDKKASDNKPEITVYNNFYINQSWVRADAKISDILAHEQGHFDLCELYTRKLKSRIDTAIAETDAAYVQESLRRIYNEVSAEYESRQVCYERETIHGTDIENQKKWTETIAGELSVSGN